MDATDHSPLLDQLAKLPQEGGEGHRQGCSNRT
jgi:hypothetical protein